MHYPWHEQGNDPRPNDVGPISDGNGAIRGRNEHGRFPVNHYRGRLIRAVITLALILLAPPLWADDGYSDFWQYCFHYSRHWNPDITVQEVNVFCRSTWDGVGRDDRKARLYFHVSIQESGLHQIDNKAGFGWSGATWPVIKRSLGWKGPGSWIWVERHPYQTNRAIAAYFAKKVDENNVSWWHNADDPLRNVRYAEKVAWIKNYCK